MADQHLATAGGRRWSNMVGRLLMVGIQWPMSVCRPLVVDHPWSTMVGRLLMVDIQWPVSTCRPLMVDHPWSTMVGRLVIVGIQWPISSCHPLMVDHPWSTMVGRIFIYRKYRKLHQSSQSVVHFCLQVAMDAPAQ